MFVHVLRSLRPKQWIKNILILAPLFFAKKALNPYLMLDVCVALIAFIMVSGAVYLLNDIIDYKKDRLHPVKKNRPIASKKLKRRAATIVLICLLISAGAVAHYLPTKFLLILGVYFGMQILYSFVLKKIVLLDVFVISMGFVFRVMAGGFAARVEISFWILLCTFLGSLFLALSKRKNELEVMSDEGAINHRRALKEYSEELLQQLISITAGSTILVYALYTQDHDTILKFGTDGLKYTIPFVVYGLFRYMYLSFQKRQGGDPSEVFLRDKPMIANIVIFLIVSFIILY
jgi:4-hydroxybenzoate polyprenyltransferase